jgi:hypothetical protein
VFCCRDLIVKHSPFELGVPVAKNSFRENDQGRFIRLGTVGMMNVLVEESDEGNGLKSFTGTHLVGKLIKNEKRNELIENETRKKKRRRD